MVEYQTNMYEDMLAETVMIRGAGGDVINADFARPLGPGPFPGVVLAHHAPGWDAQVFAFFNKHLGASPAK